MRAGAIISAFAHAGVLAWVLLGTPKPFETANGEPVMVDLVTAEEVPKVAPPKPQEPPQPEAERPPLIPPRETAVSEKPLVAFVPAQPQASAPQPAPPPQPAPQQQPAAAQPPQQPAPAPQRRAAAPPQPAPAAPSPPQEPPSIFDPASIPKLLDLAPMQQQQQQQQQQQAPQYDALADVAASLSGREVAAFKTHLKRCLKLPAGVDAARDLKVVMRVFLKPDGALAADPMLVAAPAAQEGPAMVKAATQAFKACQPYALPPEKYNDWKTLDVTLSPRDMAGG
jgi:hypothetical protein